ILAGFFVNEGLVQQVRASPIPIVFNVATDPVGRLSVVSAERMGEDAERRKKARVPEEIEFKTKPQIALDQLRAACAAGEPHGVVLDDSSYVSNSALRAGVSELGLRYVVGIIPTIKVKAVLRRGKLGKRMSVKRLARRLPKDAWQTITWREGTNNVLRSRFARLQVHTA